MRNLVHLALAAGALIVPATLANAATLVQTSTVERQTTDIHTDPITLNGFDSSLGVLTGVQIDYGFGIDSEGFFINNGITDAKFTFNANYYVDFTFDGPSSIAGTSSINFETGDISYSGLAVGEQVDYGPYNVFDSATLNPVDISQFIDTDFSYSLDTWTGMTMIGGGGNIRQSLRTYGEGYVTVTYTYDAIPTPGVPEPASWAMLIAGFGLLGGNLRRNRRQLRRALA